MPGLLQATAYFHDATDEGSEIASLTAGIATGQLGTAEREAIRKLGKLAAEAAGFLSSLGTPEAQAAISVVLTSLGVC